MLRKFGVLLLAALGLSCAHAPIRPAERHYTMMLGANHAGSQVTRIESGRQVIEFEFNDRGRGPKTRTEIRLGDSSIPIEEKTTGVDYFKGAVDEMFSRDGSAARWKNKAENGEQRADSASFYVSMYGPPEETAILANALLASLTRRLSLLPAGEASIERAAELTVNGTQGPKQIVDYAITGLSFTPVDVWLERDGTFFGSVSTWATILPDGYSDAASAMLDAQKSAEARRSAQLAQRLTRKPSGPIVIRNARLFDSTTATTLPSTTIVISGNHVTAVGPEGTIAVPSGAMAIDAAGKTVIPGLWDMHVHLQGDVDGLMDIAAGVTTVRDMANDIDAMSEWRRKFASGEAIGPRIIAAGFMDGPGPYAGPTKVLVDSEAEIKAAIDRYKQLGYEQIKVYSSMRPALVPFITRYSHENGLRVSGHIPAFMIAEDAIRQGFNEIQHMNFLFLNFMPDVGDTRTPVRFTAVAERGADLDLQSAAVRSFVDLMKTKGIVSDPTLIVFEGLFTAHPGQISPDKAEIADRFPTQVRRGFLTGGLPIPEGKDERYRASFHRMLDFAKLLYDSGVTIVGGTDGMAGFDLARELELYAEAGIPAPKVLQIATLGAARVMKHDGQVGSIEPGKLADLVIIDGDPSVNIHDLRNVVTVIKDGNVFNSREVQQAIGMVPR